VSAPFVGTHHLVRLILRRDRIRLPLWLVGLGGTIASSAAAVPAVYDTPEKVASYASVVGTSPVSYLMSGRQAGIDTIGGIVANEVSQVAQLGICLMVMFLVVRHTRSEEESGRAELLRSTVLGRHAATLAGLLYAVSAAVLIGMITTGVMLTSGLDTVGSLTTASVWPCSACATSGPAWSPPSSRRQRVERSGCPAWRSRSATSSGASAPCGTTRSCGPRPSGGPSAWTRSAPSEGGPPFPSSR
jgi:putative exporter of polyketide antibiotics